MWDKITETAQPPTFENFRDQPEVIRAIEVLKNKWLNAKKVLDDIYRLKASDPTLRIAWKDSFARQIRDEAKRFNQWEQSRLEELLWLKWVQGTDYQKSLDATGKPAPDTDQINTKDAPSWNKLNWAPISTLRDPSGSVTQWMVTALQRGKYIEKP